MQEINGIGIDRKKRRKYLKLINVTAKYTLDTEKTLIFLYWKDILYLCK